MNKPDHYNELARRYPAFIQALSRLGETVQSLGPLDARTCHLIQLAAAAARGSEGAVHSHARRALEAGASADDVNHTLLCLTSTIGFPAVSAALCWVDDLEQMRARDGAGTAAFTRDARLGP